jgi:hypothetical protein
VGSKEPSIGNFCLLSHFLEDGGSKLLENIKNPLPDYTTPSQNITVLISAIVGAFSFKRKLKLNDLANG